MKVKDVMTKDPMTIDPEAPLGTAIEVMIERKIRHLPVVDDRQAVIGIITDRDLRSVIVAPAVEQYLSRAARRRLQAIAGTFENLKVKDAMTRNPITTTPEVSVSQAAAIMLEKRIGSLPVIENGKLVGIVTDRDAVKALAIHVPVLKYAAETLW